MMHRVQTAKSSSHRIKPAYFDKIQRAAQRRWEQLESDSELAGPWHQLFRQVQSPRHVLSELLQNADDAGARRVWVRVQDGCFVFEHDGKDFTDEEFASLCRFGFSNKRNLHTIGFRGVGFKSTFSLGDNVEVCTPTLAIRFHKKRFTLPIWMTEAQPCKNTVIRVKIQDTNRANELDKNFQDWIQSPASLLFFQNVRELEIDGHVIQRKVIGPEPCKNSQRVGLTSTESEELLVIRSEAEPFPEAVLEEIKQERNAEDLRLPPCRVEIVLGLPSEQRIYVVLPTGVQPSLPFSCNGPFLQDPARLGIKDPALSPTNRWLLERVGRLVAQSLFAWLDNRNLGIEERALGYALLPSPPLQEDTLNADVTEIVAETFCECAEEEPILLTADAELATPPGCYAFPRELHATWDTRQLAEIFGKTDYPALAPQVDDQHQKLLADWDWINLVTIREVIHALTDGPNPPKPQSWEGLAYLWQLVQEQKAGVHGYSWRPRVQIVPVEGEETLYRSEDVVRLAGGRRSSTSADDWHFVANLVAVIDSDWIDFLKPPTDSEDETDLSVYPYVYAARALLETLGLNSVTSTEKVLAKASEGLFQHDEIALDDAVRFAQIVAAFDAKISDSFCYVTWDEMVAGVDEGIIIDTTGEVEELLPKDWTEEHLLHSQYFGPFTSCSQSQWFAWAKSEKSGLLTFAPFKETTQSLWMRNRLEEFLRVRNAEAPREYYYRSGKFQIIDFALDKQVENYLEQLAKRDPTVWCRVLKLLLSGPTKQWSECIHASVYEVATNGATRRARCDRFAAAWVHQLSGRACVPDIYDRPRVPADLLMRTPDTEPLMGVEAFIKADYDTEVNRPLLKLLGVRDTPSSPEKLVERIRALSGIASPPIQEVTKWYEALDKLVARCSPAELGKLKETFASERLILSNDNGVHLTWTTSGEIFRFTDEESLPGAPVVHSNVASLPLWRRLGVADRPTAELVIQWLQSLDSGAKLDGPTIHRVRACVQTYPEQVWLECGHWPTLDNTWSPVDELEFRVEHGSIERVADLFPAVRARTADFRTLSPEVALKPMFTELQELGAALEFRLTDKRAFRPVLPPRPWMVALGCGLQRVSLAEEDHTERVRELGVLLATTQWQTVQFLRVTPYLDGAPAGPPRSPEVLWHERMLYVLDHPMSQLFKPLVDELSRVFGWPSISDAIKACVDRDEEFVEGYIEHNFELVEDVELETDQTSFDADEETEEAATSWEDVATQPTISGGKEQITEDIRVGEGKVSSTTTAFDDIAASPEEPGHEEEEVNVAAEAGTHTEPPVPKPRPEPHVSLIDLYAKLTGFRWDRRRALYVHHSRRTLGKCQGIFNYELVSAAGNTERRLWVSEQCLTDGVEISADLWDVVSRTPQDCSVVLITPDGQPRELLGPELLRMTKSGDVKLFPAKYCLRQVS